MNISGKKTSRDEPSAQKAIFTSNGVANDFTVDAAVPFNYETLYENLDSLKSVLLDSKNPQEIIDVLVKAEAEKKCAGFLIKILSRLLFSKNVRLELDALIAAFSIPLRGNISHSKIAKEHGISREAFSEKIHDIVIELGIRPPRLCKDPKSSSKYKNNNKRNHTKIYENE